jgi:hypothetical protein
MDSGIATIEQEVLRWPGVTSAPGRFGAVAFRYGKREIGHIHRDRIADLPVAKEVREDLLLKGCARPHRAGVRGYISYPIQSQEDVSVVIEILDWTTTGRRPPRRSSPRAAREVWRIEHERVYAGGDRLPRQQPGSLATINEAGEPHVVSVGFRYNVSGTP